MGVPLILITLFGNKILPKSGMWMETVKKLFGFVMLALPVFLISRILPEEWTPRLWAMLGTAFFIWFAFQMPKNGTGWVFRILFLVAAMISVKPLQTWVWGETSTPSAVENKVVLEHQIFQELMKQERMKAARRPLLMQAKDFHWTFVEEGLKLSFYLPAGSYATALVRELVNIKEEE